MAIEQAGVDVTNQTQYPIMPDLALGFEPAEWLVINEHVSAQVAVSFDGLNDHAVLTPGTPSAGLYLRQRMRQIYCRRIGDGTGIVVRVIAETR